MSDVESPHKSGPTQVVERGETYCHSNHGRITVTGIWKGVHQVGTARNTNETGVIIVRYSTEGDGNTVGVDELTDTLDEFLTAIE